MLNNLNSYEYHTSESRGIVPGMDFYVNLIKKELFKVKKTITNIRGHYVSKKFKNPLDREKAVNKAIEEHVINIPIVLEIAEPLVDFPIRKLTITFKDLSKTARAVYKDEITVFENGEIKEATIGLKLYIDLNDFKNPIEIKDMAYSRVPHELTHLYQHYKWKNKENYSKNRQILKKEFSDLAKKNREIADNKDTNKEVKNKKETNEFLTHFLNKAIYYFSEKEIAAKVTQTYYELVKEKACKKDFFEKLKETTHWSILNDFYIFNLDLLYDMVRDGHTVVLTGTKNKVKVKIKMNFNEEDLSNIIKELDNIITPERRPDIDHKYNLKYYYDKPREFFLKLFKVLEGQMDKFKKKILKLIVQLPDETPVVVKKIKKDNVVNVDTNIQEAPIILDLPEDLENPIV